MGPRSGTHSNPALHSAYQAIAVAEGCLRVAAAKAAASGDYDAVALITRWAKSLQSLTSESSGDTLPLALAATLAGSPATTRRQPKITPGAPAFSRDGDMLVKTARSKKSKNEYEHRAPVDVVATVAECLSDWRPSRKLLTGEQLLDAYAKRKGAVISYQVYATLGWFGQLGLVRRHRRSGYSVPNPHTIVTDVQKAWSSLSNGQRK